MGRKAKVDAKDLDIIIESWWLHMDGKNNLSDLGSTVRKIVAKWRDQGSPALKARIKKIERMLNSYHGN